MEIVPLWGNFVKLRLIILTYPRMPCGDPLTVEFLLSRDRPGMQVKHVDMVTIGA